MSSMRSAAISSRRPRAKLFWSRERLAHLLELAGRPCFEVGAPGVDSARLADGGTASPVNCSRASRRKASASGTCSRLVNEA